MANNIEIGTRVELIGEVPLTGTIERVGGTRFQIKLDNKARRWVNKDDQGETWRFADGATP